MLKIFYYKELMLKNLNCINEEKWNVPKSFSLDIAHVKLGLHFSVPQPNLLDAAQPWAGRQRGQRGQRGREWRRGTKKIYAYSKMLIISAEHYVWYSFPSFFFCCPVYFSDLPRHSHILHPVRHIWSIVPPVYIFLQLLERALLLGAVKGMNFRWGAFILFFYSILL